MRAAPEETQALLVEPSRSASSRPPYVGHRGWLGVRLDRGLDWNEVAGIAEDAYAEVAAKLVEAARADGTRRSLTTKAPFRRGGAWRKAAPAARTFGR